MSAQPVLGPHKMPHGTFMDPRQAILFYGHVLDRQEMARLSAAANQPVGPATDSGWHRAVAGCKRAAVAIHETLAAWRDRANGRRNLAGLDARLLKDIGLTKTDVWHESNKPFWQP